MAFVRCERDGDIGVVTLDDPSSLNAMSPALMRELAAAIEAESAEGQARALILTGAGRGFCSGQNLKLREGLGPDVLAGVLQHYFPVFRARLTLLLIAVAGCARTPTVFINEIAVGEQAWKRAPASLEPRASFELECPKDQVHVAVLREAGNEPQPASP